MNILVPHNWLKDYIKTDAKPADIANALSLHAFSVEKTIEAAGGEPVYEIEITPNRGDALSVLGIARELRALLPRLGFKADWQEVENNLWYRDFALWFWKIFKLKILRIL